MIYYKEIFLNSEISNLLENIISFRTNILSNFRWNFTKMQPELFFFWLKNRTKSECSNFLKKKRRKFEADCWERDFFIRHFVEISQPLQPPEMPTPMSRSDQTRI